MDIDKEREAFEIAYSEIFSPIIKRPYPVLENGDYKYIEIDQAWKLWQAKSQAVPEKTCSIQGHEIIINETKNELINDYDIAKEDEYLLEALVYRGVCIGKSQAVPEWSSVKDSLPSGGDLVLGISPTKLARFNVYQVVALDEFEECEISHWMPLPQSPKAQEQSHE